MSGHKNNDNIETLFSFELMVEFVRIEEESKVSDELALAVRLLDFPTLLIYQPQRSSDVTKRGNRGACQTGEHVFNRGKCCFFKMNLRSLHSQLLSIPLYVMLLDVKEEIPKLVGTSLIPLGDVMDRIRQDVTEHGTATPSSHGIRGFTVLSNVMGERIGSISLSYKLLSLGAVVLPLITDSKSTRLHGEQHAQAQERGLEKNESAELLHLECENGLSVILNKSDVRRNNPDSTSNDSNLTPDNKPDSDVCGAMKPEHKPRIRILQTSQTENSFEEDFTVFCPPHLFYKNSSEENSKKEEWGWKSLNPDSEPFMLDDSEEETSEMNIGCVNSSFMSQSVKQDVTKKQQTSGVTPNVFGVALQRLPLLNALLAELSHLSGQNPQQPLSVHPNLSWIYRPASPEPLLGLRNTAEKTQKSHVSHPHLKHMHPHRKCSTPVFRPSSVKNTDKQDEALMKSTSHRKKLVYGTTKTFNLRLKLLSSRGAKQRECIKLIQDKTQTNMVKGKEMTNKKMSNKRKLGLNHSIENIEKMTQSVTVDLTLQETVTLQRENLNEKVHGKETRNPLKTSDCCSLSERDCKVTHVSSIDVDGVDKHEDQSEHRRASNQSEPQSDGLREKILSSGISICNNPKSSSSDSGEVDEKEDYTDDFDSLDSSDGVSPDPASSPKLSISQTPKSPLHPDFNSDSDILENRPVLPQPFESSLWPALGSTYIIQTPTDASTLSSSSNDVDSNRSAFSQATHSRKQSDTRGMGRIFVADSLPSSQGQNSESTKSSGSGQRYSEKLMCSFEPQEIEELDNEHGLLDFKKEYQHISKMVAPKTPGYTI
ncbi:microtubule-associated protein 10 [Antennarius striatus]|uniref:microtubule-associated protein 10 n=1 Tax=Antennarius striatus TaxID=241820 RepID=UPI0035AF6A32